MISVTGGLELHDLCHRRAGEPLKPDGGINPQKSFFEGDDDTIQVHPVDTQDETIDLLIEKTQYQGNVPVTKELDHRVAVPG
jgi:hypothetical protein